VAILSFAINTKKNIHFDKDYPSIIPAFCELLMGHKMLLLFSFKMGYKGDQNSKILHI
jgi:hypothetical protein